ncbi:uncharacterized protein BX664DRAFT_321352 [Halteromyces radiatus]|uniref:uncharacterized protein n=1 Tax=Halteromyces radiatus TaxID=101107 RepID=UPI002220A0F7|nr:uncharacterized protein BX664DRAFT_321352 [Halteromyces radiatus]KAI8099484.1 hypothetical protein BX664DRAFT_321352 [Halteromyces radiatus]
MKRYTFNEVANHTSTKSCWVIYDKKVYDVTEFMMDHPGGDDLILDYAGKDVTAVMKDVMEHEHSEAAYDILADYCIGELDDNKQCFSSSVTVDKKQALHRQRMQLLEQLEESKTYGMADFHPKETDANADIKTHQFLDLRKALIPQFFTSSFTKEFYLEQVHKPRYLPTPAIFFGHPLLEPLSKTVWYVVPLLWLPFSAYQLYISSTYDMIPLTCFSFVLGILIWTLLEYLLHRFLFHVDDYLPDHQIAFLLHFTLHGFHHYLPMDRLRLVMPPTLGIVIAYPLINLGHFLFPPIMAYAVISGGVLGYVMYDCIHYYLHHAKVFEFHFKEMKKYHMAHHYKNYEDGYGITSKLWDVIFGTVLKYGPMTTNE